MDRADITKMTHEFAKAALIGLLSNSKQGVPGIWSLDPGKSMRVTQETAQQFAAAAYTIADAMMAHVAPPI